MELKNKIKAILFDCDGTLMDTEPCMGMITIDYFRKMFGFEAKPEDFVPFYGMGEVAYFGGVLKKYGHEYSDALKDEIYGLYIQECHKYVSTYPGVLDTIHEMGKRGYKMAVVSGADRCKVEANMRAGKIQMDIVTELITATECTKIKPHPDMFLMAAEKLGVRPDECLVCEDAVSGVMAGKNAGMLCLAVTTTRTEEDLRKAGADFIVPSVNALRDML